MNHAGKDHHASHHAHEKPRRQFHKDWRVWTIVIVLLAAMAIYVVTNDEVLRPGPGPQQPVPGAPAK
jgi:hypothetical protein